MSTIRSVAGGEMSPSSSPPETIPGATELQDTECTWMSVYSWLSSQEPNSLKDPLKACLSAPGHYCSKRINLHVNVRVTPSHRHVIFSPDFDWKALIYSGSEPACSLLLCGGIRMPFFTQLGMLRIGLELGETEPTCSK